MDVILEIEAEAASRMQTKDGLITLLSMLKERQARSPPLSLPLSPPSSTSCRFRDSLLLRQYSLRLFPVKGCVQV